MAKTRVQKEEALKNLKENVAKAKSIVMVNFDKLKVKDIEEFRKTTRKQNVGYQVAKKTLIDLAMKEKGVANFNRKTVTTSVGMVLGYDDEVIPAKVAQDFSKDHEALSIVGGIFQGEFVGTDKIKQLAALPSKEVLLARMVGSIKAPISGFVGVLNGNLRNLVYVLNAIKDTKN